MTEKPKAYILRQTGDTVLNNFFIVFFPDKQSISVSGSIDDLARDVVRVSADYSVHHDGFTPQDVQITDPHKYRLLQRHEIARTHEALSRWDAALAAQVFGARGKIVYLFREKGGTIGSNWFGIFGSDWQGNVASRDEIARTLIQAVKEHCSVVLTGFAMDDVGVSQAYKYRPLTPAEIALMREEVARFDPAVAEQVFGDAPRQGAVR